MQTIFNRHQFISTAKQGGMPSYWSAIEISLCNDRLPETKSGFREGWDG